MRIFSEPSGEKSPKSPKGIDKLRKIYYNIDYNNDYDTSEVSSGYTGFEIYRRGGRYGQNSDPYMQTMRAQMGTENLLSGSLPELSFSLLEQAAKTQDKSQEKEALIIT